MSEILNVRATQQNFAEISLTFEEISSEVSTIYVLLVTDADAEADRALDSCDYVCYPVICERTPSGNNFCWTSCINNNKKTYETWQSFRTNNNLPAGIMVAPLNGVYAFDDDGQVLLEQQKMSVEKRKAKEARDVQQKYAEISKHTNCGVIYILVTQQEDENAALTSEKFSVHFVFRRKGHSGDFYFQHGDDIFESWEFYLSNNKLPRGIMIAPVKGVYTFNESGKVELEVHLTPISLPRLTIRNVHEHYANMANDNSAVSVIRVLVTKHDDLDTVLDSTEYFEFLVYRKNYEVDGENYFHHEDEVGNPYATWDCFLNDNALIEGIMVTPLNGSYTYNADGQVELDVRLTPAKASRLQEKEATAKAKKEIQKRTIKEIQQDFANNSGFQSKIIWDLLSASQKCILSEKINQLIKNQDGKEATDRKIKEMRKTLLESIWAQRKYTNNNSLSAIIYVFVTNSESIDRAEYSTSFSCHPVFRTRKCVGEKNNHDSSGYCMIFIDELGRVYQNWKKYLSDNELPPGVMVAPLNGCYTFDNESNVKLEKCVTPNGGAARKSLAIADTTTAVAGVGAGLVPLAALAVTVTPPVMVGAAAVAIATGAYSLMRSAYNLLDRNKHEQSIGLGDAQARNSWIGVGAGAVGLGATGATRLMTTAAATREVSAATQMIVNGLNISSVLLSGSGIANGILDLILKYRDEEEITSLDIVQLAASLVLFTHSVNNFSLASTLVNDAQNNKIQTYRKSLSRNQRKMFDKISKETIRTRGETRGKIDIIRNVNEIPSKQYLNDLAKINKKLNEAKIRPSFGASGEGVVLNNQVPVDTHELRNNVQHNRGPNILGSVTQPIPSSYNEMGNVNNPNTAQLLFSKSNTNVTSKGISSEPKTIAIRLPNGVIIVLAKYGKKLFEMISNMNSFNDIITSMGATLSEDSFDFLMNIAKDFLENYSDGIQRVSQIYISSESVIYKIFTYCMEYYIDLSYNYLCTKEEKILQAINDYFSSLNPNSDKSLRTKCNICDGFYSLCNLN